MEYVRRKINGALGLLKKNLKEWSQELREIL